MKKSVLLYLLIFILSQKLFAQSDSLYDLFPLAKGTQYSYTYQFSDTTYWVSILESIQNDSGSVTYLIKDSTLNGNEIDWLVEQKKELMRHLVLYNFDNSNIDSIYRIEQIDEFNLTESLYGNHQITAHPPWNSDTYASVYSPLYLPVVDSIFRYQNKSASLTFFNDLFSYDSLWFDNRGLFRRNSYNSFSSNHRDYDYTKISLDSITVGIRHQKHTFPEMFYLSQNYPNPFNPITTIEYSIPKQSLVTIKVFDLLGREVATLVNEEKPAGNYIVNFNGINLSTGIYFYRLEADSYIAVKKLLLLK